ncbi:MAG TPA: hypothetical protein EYG51_22110 [Pseudomonadales bacterium]|nr:hypothetical protein [Pseudomonadales bacterium]
MTRTMRRFRCTRHKPYGPDHPGHHDRNYRKSIWIEAPSTVEALMEMVARYPEDEGAFTVDDFTADDDQYPID